MTDLPTSLNGKTIAVLGGTGPQGRGLAGRFAAAGLRVVIGSRSAERAATTATATFGSPTAHSATASTSTVPAMLCPQWQT